MLDYGDELAFKVKPETKAISIETPLTGVKPEDNLIVKAAKALQQFADVSQGCQIYLNKKLPMGGGIGGGSSNAATTLLVLNRLWNCGLSQQQLADIGLQLGADVPVFVHGNTAFAEGIGEHLIPQPVASKWYLVVFPNCHISTAEIFNADQLPRSTPKMQPGDYHFDVTHNDCQNLVIDRYPEVANLLQWLLQFAPSRMTGTGACVFAVFDEQHKALETHQKLPAKWQGFIAQGVDQSPLLSMLSEQD